MKPKEKLLASMERASQSPHTQNDLEVMNLGFFILPNVLLVTGLTLSLIAFLCESIHWRYFGRLAKQEA